MADNYLEKRMADYERGRGAVAKSCHAGRRAGWVSVQFPAATVCVTDADSPAGRDVVEIFVQAGLKVVFICCDVAEGRKISQLCGGRFYPGGAEQMVADMEKRSEHIDVEILCQDAPGTGFKTSAAKKLIISADERWLPENLECLSIVGSDTRQAARLALMACHPSAEMPAQLIRVKE